MFNGVQYYEYVPVAVPAEQYYLHDQETGIFSSDEFRMYSYKIKRCPRMRSHDWTDCPYAHRGEKAQRRDPRRYAYAAVVCPAFRDGICYKGETCEFAHGVFEYWLHPARYRTRTCNAGRLCTRKVCFFAHSPGQLRSTPPPPADSAVKCPKCRHHHHHHHVQSSNYVYRPVGEHAGKMSEGASAAALVNSPELVANNNDISVDDRFSEFLTSLRSLKLNRGEGDSGGWMDSRVDHLGLPESLDVQQVDWVSELLQ